MPSLDVCMRYWARLPRCNFPSGLGSPRARKILVSSDASSGDASGARAVLFLLLGTCTWENPSVTATFAPSSPRPYPHLPSPLPRSRHCCFPPAPAKRARIFPLLCASRQENPRVTGDFAPLETYISSPPSVVPFVLAFPLSRRKQVKSFSSLVSFSICFFRSVTPILPFFGFADLIWRTRSKKGK